MASRNSIILATTICLAYFVAEGGREYRSKDVVKTIETKDGVYDCVDFYKQPAFSHPLLKNHSYHPEMRPSSRPKWMTNANQNAEEISTIGTKLNCPTGTVPIRKLSDDDRRLQKETRRFNYSQLGEKHPDNGSNSESIIYFALGQSKADVSKVYNGIGADLSIFNPKVLPSQYSSGEMIIKGGQYVIIIGWTVNPMVYRDSQTRFFMYTVAGDLRCFDSQCGFILVREDIPLDFTIKPVSTVKKDSYMYPYFVYQDAKNGAWWLEVGSDNTILGWWPQEIFRGLFKSGNYVACGGEVSGPLNLGYPKMGSGYKPKSTFTDWSYCKDIQVVDESNNVVYIHDLDTYSSSEDQYDVFWFDQGNQRYLMYGGPDND